MKPRKAKNAGTPAKSASATALGRAPGRTFGSMLETIGATPLVRVAKLEKDARAGASVLAKCEFFNPLSSVKDRIGLAMIEALEEEGRLRPGATVIEPTSGNTGIALAFVCAAKDYRLILTMPETMSEERRKMLRLLGAELELTEGALGMRGALARAEELCAEIPGAVIPQQFSNPANPAIHRATTGEEIWRDCGGRIDAFVVGVGTGGTLTGAGGLLKERNPKLKIYAVEPEDSPVISGGLPGGHKIQGIGAGFIPDNLDCALIDGVLRIANETAFTMARKAARLEGLPCGISSGAALAAALELATKKEMAGKTIVTVLPSFAERYLTTELFEGL